MTRLLQTCLLAAALLLPADCFKVAPAPAGETPWAEAEGRQLSEGTSCDAIDTTFRRRSISYRRDWRSVGLVVVVLAEEGIERGHTCGRARCSVVVSPLDQWWRLPGVAKWAPLGSSGAGSCWSGAP